MDKSLGQKIREWRMRKGITQTELAEGLVTPSMISQIESDKANPSFKLLEGISRKLDVPIDEFLMDMQEQLEEDTRYKLAKSLMGTKDYAKAISVLEGLSSTDDAHENEIKFDLADAYVHSKNFEKANKLLEGMLEVVALERDRSKAVQLYWKLGWAKMRANDYIMAKHYFNQSLKELSKATDYAAEQKGILFVHYALTLSYLGEVQGALGYYKNAIDTFQGTSSLNLLGFAYQGLANTYYRLGEFKLAAETTRTAITMFRSVNDRLQEFRTKQNYAIIQYELQNYSEAISLFQECIDEFKALKENDLIANVYGEMGIVHFRMKEYQNAEKWCFRALELLPAEHSERAFVYRTMGLMYKELQNQERSLEYMLSSAGLFEKFGLLGEVSKCYAQIVSIYDSRGELEKASEYMQKMTSSMQEGLRVRGLYL
ncbi:helix-turn-helix domain-containing protein [Tumebacillus permanentifrigoris]|uniref:DNA-binding XRE family transcriptional regulator n=1 Tax=Tumebacillus permanentifrigoris TaxID=378543 RepID=A0A316DE31_9BACL|nr:helix-turn-helix domain-containing protein [Tumebacillus permanentifrigoris]PWK16225.1 DNA-binding XRE family transcriptional regulator [Tumebacillus permanentifrigoris]